MGHSHYWTFSAKPNQENYKRAKVIIAEFVKYCMEKKGYALVDKTNKKWVDFNGVGNDGCEDFYLEPTAKAGFNFCKTYERPYDAVVVGACLLLKGEMDTEVKVSSDGIGNLDQSNFYFENGAGMALLIDFLCDTKEFPRGRITIIELLTKMIDWFNHNKVTVDYEKIIMSCPEIRDALGGEIVED
jgi:hypothetical protein